MARCMNTEWGRVAVAGSGFLADAFDLQVINTVADIMGSLYWQGGKGLNPHDASDYADLRDWLKNASTIGAIAGQLMFGFLADRLGRRAIFFTTGALIVLSSVASAVAPGSNPRAVYYWVIACRLLLGVGIGGEYPLSATITAEGCPARRRGTLMACVFSMQGVGYVLSSLVLIVLTFGFPEDLNVQWRGSLALGTLLPLASLYFRLRLHESPAFRQVAEARAAGDASVSRRATLWRYRYHVAGTALNWCLFDVCFYGNGLFSGAVNREVSGGWGRLTASQNEALQVMVTNAIQLPGYVFGILFINSMGRKRMQLMGYAGMVVFFSICAFAYDSLASPTASGVEKALFIFLYGMTFFFSDFGPNTTTYIVAGELFPSQIKATCHGFSAALGKCGAYFGGKLFARITTADGSPNVGVLFPLCACISVVGLLVTVVLTPSYVAEDLEPKESGETVAYVPLDCQRKAGEEALVESGSSA